MKITRFKAGDPATLSVLSEQRMNGIVDPVNALLAMEVQPPGLATVSVTDANVVIKFNAQSFQEVIESGVISTFLVAKRIGPA